MRRKRTVRLSVSILCALLVLASIDSLPATARAQAQQRPLYYAGRSERLYARLAALDNRVFDNRERARLIETDVAAMRQTHADLQAAAREVLPAATRFFTRQEERASGRSLASFTGVRLGDEAISAIDRLGNAIADMERVGNDAAMAGALVCSAVRDPFSVDDPGAVLDQTRRSLAEVEAVLHKSSASVARTRGVAADRVRVAQDLEADLEVTATQGSEFAALGPLVEDAASLRDELALQIERAAAYKSDFDAHARRVDELAAAIRTIGAEILREPDSDLEAEGVRATFEELDRSMGSRPSAPEIPAFSTNLRSYFPQTGADGRRLSWLDELGVSGSAWSEAQFDASARNYAAGNAQVDGLRIQRDDAVEELGQFEAFLSTATTTVAELQTSLDEARACEVELRGWTQANVPGALDILPELESRVSELEVRARGVNDDLRRMRILGSEIREREGAVDEALGQVVTILESFAGLNHELLEEVDRRTSGGRISQSLIADVREGADELEAAKSALAASFLEAARSADATCELAETQGSEELALSEAEEHRYLAGVWAENLLAASNRIPFIEMSLVPAHEELRSESERIFDLYAAGAALASIEDPMNPYLLARQNDGAARTRLSEARELRRTATPGLEALSADAETVRQSLGLAEQQTLTAPEQERLALLRGRLERVVDSLLPMPPEQDVRGLERRARDIDPSVFAGDRAARASTALGRLENTVADLRIIRDTFARPSPDVNAARGALDRVESVYEDDTLPQEDVDRVLDRLNRCSTDLQGLLDVDDRLDLLEEEAERESADDEANSLADLARRVAELETRVEATNRDIAYVEELDADIADHNALIDRDIDRLLETPVVVSGDEATVLDEVGGYRDGLRVRLMGSAQLVDDLVDSLGIDARDLEAQITQVGAVADRWCSAPGSLAGADDADANRLSQRLGEYAAATRLSLDRAASTMDRLDAQMTNLESRIEDVRGVAAVARQLNEIPDPLPIWRSANSLWQWLDRTIPERRRLVDRLTEEIRELQLEAGQLDLDLTTAELDAGEEASDGIRDLKAKRFAALTALRTQPQALPRLDSPKDRLAQRAGVPNYYPFEAIIERLSPLRQVTGSGFAEDIVRAQRSLDAAEQALSAPIRTPIDVDVAAGRAEGCLERAMQPASDVPEEGEAAPPDPVLPGPDEARTPPTEEPPPGGGVEATDPPLPPDPEIPLPGVGGMQIADAVAAIEAVGLRLAELRAGSPATPETPEGIVERAQAAAGGPLHRGDAVVLYAHVSVVQSGNVPVVVGWHITEAVAAVEQAGFVPVIEVGDETTDPAREATVSRQGGYFYRSDGTRERVEVALGSEVILEVYVLEIRGMVVPDLVGETIDVAQWLVEGDDDDDEDRLFLNVTIESDAPSVDDEGVVLRQYPEPGLEIPRGTAVDVWIYGNYVEPPPGEPTPNNAGPGGAAGAGGGGAGDPYGPEYIQVPTSITGFSQDYGRLSAYSDDLPVDGDSGYVARPPGGWPRHPDRFDLNWVQVQYDFRWDTDGGGLLLIPLVMTVGWSAEADAVCPWDPSTTNPRAHSFTLASRGIPVTAFMGAPQEDVTTAISFDEAQRALEALAQQVAPYAGTCR